MNVISKETNIAMVIMYACQIYIVVEYPRPYLWVGLFLLPIGYVVLYFKIKRLIKREKEKRRKYYDQFNIFN